MNQSTEIVGKVPSLDEALHTFKPIEITLDEAKTLLARAVKEKGAAYVYEQVEVNGHQKCAYFDPATKAPSCLVGQVLAYKGVTYEDLVAQDTEYDRHLGISLVMGDVNDLREHKVISVDNQVAGLLTVAQSEQDQGQPWGRAVEEALSEYASVADAYETEGQPIPEDYWL